MRRYYLSASAREDLASISAWYRREAGREVARAVITRIRSKLRMIAEAGGTIGQPRDELRPGIRSFPVRPHVIFFRYLGDEIEIVRVLHGRRDVEHEFSSR